jgi:hypothetical protein
MAAAQKSLDALARDLVLRHASAKSSTLIKSRKKRAKMGTRDANWEAIKNLARSETLGPDLLAAHAVSILASTPLTMEEAGNMWDLLDRLFERSKEFRAALLQPARFKTLTLCLLREAASPRALLCFEKWASKFGAGHPALLVALRARKETLAAAAPPPPPPAASTSSPVAALDGTLAIVRSCRRFQGAIPMDEDDALALSLSDAKAKTGVIRAGLDLLSHPVFSSSADADDDDAGDDVGDDAAIDGDNGGGENDDDGIAWDHEGEEQEDAAASSLEARAAAAVAFYPADYLVQVRVGAQEEPHGDADVRANVRDARMELEHLILPQIQMASGALESYPACPREVLAAVQALRLDVNLVLDMCSRMGV